MEVVNQAKWAQFENAVRRGNVLCVLDNDGVASPIVTDPTMATPYPATLERISSHSRTIEMAMLSGRPIGFLERTFPIPGLSHVGLYGRQFQVHGDRWNHPDAVARMGDMAIGRQRVQAALTEVDIKLSGLRLEDKDGITFGMSWRPLRAMKKLALERYGAASGEYADLQHQERLIETHVRRIMNGVADDLGLAALVGAVSCELAVPGIDKGTGIVDLVDALLQRDVQIEAVAFLGDEARDKPGWDALARLERTHNVATLRGLVENEDATSDLRNAVDVILGGVEEVPYFLDAIAEPPSLGRAVGLGGW